MKGLYFTDIHTYPYNEFSKPTSDGRTSLIVEHDLTYRWVADNIRSARPDYVVFVGDTALTHGYLDAMSLTSIEQGYRAIREACTLVGAELFWMLGNHDFLNDASRIHVLPFIREVVADVCVREHLLFIPFFRDQDDWIKYREHYTDKIRKVFVHLDIVGARYNSSPNVCSNGISPTDFRFDTRVFAGHFHHPQALSANFLVMGACVYRNFSDEPVTNMPRGLIIESSDGSLERVANPHTSIYQTIRVDVEDPDYLEMSLNTVRHPERTFVRLIYPRSLEAEVQRASKRFLGLKTVPIRDRKKNQVQVPDLPSAFDPHSVVDKYLEVAPPQTDRVPLKEYQDYGHAVVQEVLGGVLKQTHRQVRFLGTHIENFLSIAQMDVRYDTVGVVYVDGVIEGRESDVSNGSGKSAMMEAPYWCLFGELVRPKEKSKAGGVDKVVNNRSKGGCLVSILMQVDDIEYQIVRTRKHPQFGDDLRVFQEGNLVSQGTTASEKYIKTLIGINSDTFKHVAMFADNLSTRFSSLGPRERMELVESVIQLHVYDNLYTVIHERGKQADGRCEATKISVERNRHVLNELNSQLDGQSRDLDALKHRIQDSISTKQFELQTANASIETLVADHAKKVKVAENVRPLLKELGFQLDDAKRLTSEASSSISQITNRQSLLNHQLSHAQSLNQGICPVCQRPYDQKVDTTGLETEIQELAANLVAWQAEHAKRVEGQANVQEQINGIQANANVIDGKINLLLVQLQTTRDSSRRLASEIASLSDQLVVHERNLGSLRTRIGEIVTETDKFQSQLAGFEDQARVIRYWVEGFSPNGGCRLWMVNDALKQLSDYSVDYASHLSDGYAVPTLSIGAKSTINLDVQTQAQDYSISSSGERRQVDLSIQFAVARLSSRYSGFSCNLMSLDEVEDKLDSASRRRLISLLNRIASSDQKIILIASHYKELKSYVDRVWTIVKSDEVSRLVSAA